MRGGLIRCKYFNARSLRNKLSSFYDVIYGFDFKIICITETWLCDKFSNGLLDPKGLFYIFRRDRVSAFPSGGVCILISKSLQCNEIVADYKEREETEVVACTVLINNRKFLIVCCYIPPNTQEVQFDKVMCCLKNIWERHGEGVVVGDFNVTGIDWSTNAFANDYKSRLLSDFFTECGLEQLVSEPTRKNTTLDLLFTNDPLSISVCKTDAPFCTSDHDSILFTIFIESVQNDACPGNENVHFNWTRADWASLASYCHNIAWNILFSNCHNANDCWNSFSEIVHLGLQQFVPTFPEAKSRSRTLHNVTVHSLMSKRKHLWQQKRNNPSPLNKERYVAVTKALKLALANEEAAKELNIIKSGNLGLLYGHINSRLNHKTGIAPLINPAGQLLTSDKDKADLLNDFFVEIGTTDNGVLPHQIMNNSTKLEIIHFDQAFVKLCIGELNGASSSGPDKLPAIIFKKLVHQLSFPLAMMFNLFMQLGEIPNEWKSATVIPIFKKGASSSPENYRPISLTCIGCKIFERGIKKHLMQHFAATNQISPHQHGFLTKHSTCTNLLETMSDWTRGLDDKCETLVAFFDFAKAFDRVSIPKLIFKLNCAGIEGRLLSCIESFLSNRTQIVRVGKAISHPRPLRSGVPQGSVLGPILFIFFINNISESLPVGVKSKLFADDLKSYIRIDSELAKDYFTSTLEAISSWATAWQLPLSVLKCNWMVVSNRTEPREDMFYVNETPLLQINETKDLGVLFDSKLNFSEHISAIIGKAKQRIFLIRKCFASSNSDALILAFKIYVLPILDYCSQVWSPHCLTDIARLESVQRMFTKRLKSFENLSYQDRLKSAGLCTLERRRLMADLVLAYKVMHGLTTLDLDLQLDNNGRTRGHPWKLKISQARINSRLNFFSVRVVNVWNALSTATVCADSTGSFKMHLMNEDLSGFLTIN